YTDEIYTGEINPTIREYTCKNNHTITVGRNQQIKTIEELKEVGCPKCGQKESFTRVSRQKQ
ncbi:MAG: bis-aminopropyl spermidine synthase family protein, partial [Candidatus Heimdallarchaeota archaeon]